MPSQGKTVGKAGKARTALSRTKLRFVGSGRYSDVFKVTAGKRSVIMKLSYYRDDTLCRFVDAARKGDLRKANAAKNSDSIVVSSNFARLTNDLIVNHVSPHFVIVYCDMDCKNFASKLKPLLKDRFKTITQVQLKYNNLCFMEVFSTNLTKWLLAGKYDENTLRGVVFQVLYTLAALQKLLPGFRHNDLSANNVLVKYLHKPVTYKYTFNGQTFIVRSKLLVALSDYDFTHVPNHPKLSNERVVNKRYKVDDSWNPSYDPHFFLKSVWKCVSLRKFFKSTNAFFKSVLRSDIDRLESPISGLTPAKLLANPYFDKLHAADNAPADVVSAV